MGLTALEWLALPEDERVKRGNELSPHESYLLRSQYEYLPAGPENYPTGPLKPDNLTDEERKRHLRNSFEFMKQNKLLPEDITWEEWQDRGRPLNMTADWR